MRSIALLGICFLAACSAAPGDSTGESQDAVKYIAGFPAGSYFQIDTAHPTKDEISLLMFATTTTYWGKRCVDRACATTVAINGTYKRSKTRLYFYDAQNTLTGTYSYTYRSGTLTLHEIGSSDRYALDPMSESLCDDSGGAWSDDDLAAHGFNCTCPGEMDWGPNGCEPCPDSTCGATCGAGQTSCGGTCVDLSTDPTNCGACNATCTKAQHCVNGACR